MTGFLLMFSGSEACDGVFHDGDASNSFFGDGWDDFWNLDWRPEAKVCYSSMSVSLEEIKIDATNEVAGCTGGDGSCCESLCSSGGGAWSQG